MSKLLSEYKIKDMVLKNRVVMPPMCMYSAAADGLATEWHNVHYATRAIGQVGLIIVEATAVSPEGRISDNDLGLWSDEQITPLKKLVDTVHKSGSKIGVQLAHAGRKSTSAVTPHFSVTDVGFSDDYIKPQMLDDAEIMRLADCFKDSAKRALTVGFDFIEIHGAHGYLINTFLSPLTNTRDDKWGGSREKRFAFLELIIKNITSVWPDEKPLGVRLTTFDYAADGITQQDVDYIVAESKKLGVDIFDISSGGVINAPINAYPGYQIKLAEAVKKANDVTVIAGGLIDDLDLARDIIENERAELLFIGRALLRNPYWVQDAARKLGDDRFIPKQYSRA
ncbi:MAG: NADPH dehydrogenase [Clostridiales bacterium]|nr:MAG: NADPH dehydrogenase [Clostridiales bacterium]